MPTSPALTSVFQTIENSSQLCWSIGLIGSRVPAFRISTSGVSSRTTEFIRVASVASPAITEAPTSSAASRFDRLRLIAVTFAPLATSASTIASPSPWLPPVTTTRFPFRFCMFILLLGLPLACPILPLYLCKTGVSAQTPRYPADCFNRTRILTHAGCVARLIRQLLAFSRQRCDKVWLPGFASVIGERLFHTMRIGCDVGPDKSHKNGSSME